MVFKYVLANFLPAEFAHFWQMGTEVSSYSYTSGFVCFFLQFYKFWLHIFWFSCLLNLLISDKWVLKSPAIHILVDSSVSSYSSISSCCTYFDSVLLGVYTLRIDMSSWRTDSFSVCNVLFNPDNLHCFKVFFVWNYYSYSGFLLSCINIVYLSPSTYFQSICVFIKWVSYRWNVLGSSILINSDNLFYLMHLDHWHSTCLFM